MKRKELAELHYITPITNVPSICQRGILSHCRAQEIAHESVAMKKIQDRRAKVVIPNGRPLHEYANLYICARNPMMYKRRGKHGRLSILRVSPDVLELPNVIVTDANASAEGLYVQFAPAPRGLRVVDKELTFAEYWTSNDEIEFFRRKSKKCAEVLVPDCVSPRFLVGAYVSCDEALARINALGVALRVEINAHLFFQ